MPAHSDARIQLCGSFEAPNSDGDMLSVAGIDIATEGYVADVFVRLATPYAGPLYDDSTFIAYVRDKLRSVGYAGPGFERAESGMQGKDFIVLEPNKAFKAFAKAKGWKDLGAHDRAWSARMQPATQPTVTMQEVTFTYHLRPRNRCTLIDADFKNFSAYMGAVEGMLQDDARSIPGWYVTDTHGVECTVYEFCEPEGHYPGSGDDEKGPFEFFELELPIQVQGAWGEGEVERIAQALQEKLDVAMRDFQLLAQLRQVRSITKYAYSIKGVLFDAVNLEEGATT